LKNIEDQNQIENVVDLCALRRCKESPHRKQNRLSFLQLTKKQPTAALVPP
jgi:hypothetical protein